MDLSNKINSLHSRIAKERKMLEGLVALRSATTNVDVIKTCEAKMRESNRAIGWFEESLQDLEERLSAENGAVNNLVGSRNRNLPLPPPGAGPSYVGATPSPSQSKVFSNLDFILADSPLNSIKILKKLIFLQFKLTLESQYVLGIDKMAKLYLQDGDKKARIDTQNKRLESSQKIKLLTTALKRYKALDVGFNDADHSQSSPSLSHSY